ncbi:MAG: 50S ribosomal protein L22 [Oscillospiraceae bacterium]|jgi:large subunit ribosomal protein L22|nr:50S ribosomal protein L22 [Oscillospiraceae bacterium]
MATAKASATYIRMSPRKVQIVLDLIRKQPTEKALAILKFTPNIAAEPVLKVLKSAIANAENNFNLDPEDLYVSFASVGQGPTLKRIMARARGRSDRILKPSCHIYLAVADGEDD